MNQPYDPITLALHPTIFVIFGITGDLASRKLLPALINLYSKKMLPHRFSVVGFSRKPFSKEEFREYIRERLNIKPGQYKEEDIKHFLDNVIYEQGVFDSELSYKKLLERVNSIDLRWGQCSNKLIHLSVPPDLYEGILRNISSSGLSVPCSDETGWTRVLIEKPFGSDIENAKNLDKLLGKLFKEEQIFRIDHYLAKEALQNMLAFRFSNSIFEPLWNREHIDKVHIKLFEKSGVDGRGVFYDKIGAVKDVGQNHMLAMLSFITMERPKKLDAKHIRIERAKSLTKLKIMTRKAVQKSVTTAQYAGYREESGVFDQSRTETYFRIEATSTSPKWKNVQFFLESGKCMHDTKTEVDIYFKKTHKSEEENILTFRIQPDEGIRIRFFVKTPGYEFKTESKVLKFRYSDVATFEDRPNDYERLLNDAVIGDQTLFASTDEIMASWKFITPIIDNLHKINLINYEKGAEEIL